MTQTVPLYARRRQLNIASQAPPAVEAAPLDPAACPKCRRILKQGRAQHIRFCKGPEPAGPPVVEAAPEPVVAAPLSMGKCPFCREEIFHQPKANKKSWLVHTEDCKRRADARARAAMIPTERARMEIAENREAESA